ncbi:mitochondrial fission 1 protein-like isoform X2 [Chanodichthys erythropterus]|uniref:mitochondrial fission 1 protein-like isoform X2 n=1 Tax=Chanodichthys erythropterus TaxID=933992 RepID=UPI00351E38A1
MVLDARNSCPEALQIWPPNEQTFLERDFDAFQELIHKGTKDDQRDYLFYLAVANYKLKEYEKALKYIRTLLKNEPGNSQALDLEKFINKTMKKDGLIGMAIVGGIGLGLAGLAGLIGLAVAKKSA